MLDITKPIKTHGGYPIQVIRPEVLFEDQFFFSIKGFSGSIYRGNAIVHYEWSVTGETLNRTRSTGDILDTDLVN